MKQKAALLALGSICWAVPALANINLEFRPPSQSVSIGDTVNIGLYAVSDDETDQLLAEAQVIISWNPSFLQLLGNDGTGAVPLLSSGFPANDPFNLNEVVPPQDGDGLYVALAPPGGPVAATPEGVLLTTFQFLALADTPQTPVDILASGGDPLGETIVFDGTIPDLDVTGALIGSVVEIILEPPPGPTLLLTADPSSAQIGDPVVVTLSMWNLGSDEAAGFQASLSFDSTRLTFISGSYIPEQFGLPIILPIEADGENINLAAGIDVLGGQSPTSADSVLVQLTFEALVGGCVVSVTFRENQPATGLTDTAGNPIEPLLLIGLLDLSDVDDGDACTDDICDPDPGEVTHIPNYDTQSECCDPATGNTTLIADNDACTDDDCDPLTGQVTHTPFDPSACDDGIACTFDFCASAVGCVNAPVDVFCADADVCSSDVCDPELGCLNLTSCPTDSDDDFDTDAFDLAVLLGCWGPVQPGVCECLDADDDGDIKAFDLAILLGQWGSCGGALGACCNAGGIGGCEQLTADGCFVAGGQFLGFDTDCLDCEIIGACCLGNEECAIMTQAECGAAGGEEFNEGITQCSPNPCAFEFGPDVTYANVTSILHYGPVGGIHAYIYDSHTCNVGDQNLLWGISHNGTPVLAMNAYRMLDGRLEQIGMSWVKHTCCAVALSGCGVECNGAGGPVLGVGCRDVYGSGYNAIQGNLGARSDINAFTGTMPPADGTTGDPIFKRIQIHEADLGQPGALYFVEGVYASIDDAPAGNGLNNASYRRALLSGFNLSVTDSTQVTIPAIFAWHDHGNGVNNPDASIQTVEVDVPDEGRFYAASRVQDNGDGTWRYTYAIYNLNSHRSAGALSVPLGSGVTATNVGFHDVDYHSGELYSNTDWNGVVGADSVTWTSPQTFEEDPNTNALRWATMYTYWFDADTGPQDAQLTLGLFRPGTPDSVTFTAPAPAQ